MSISPRGLILSRTSGSACFGSGRAILSLRESYRRDLRDVKQITGLEYIRFHAIFNDEAGIYSEDVHGAPVYNFSYADQIYDGLVQNGVHPFVELSFMPQKLAAEQIVQFFWYKPIISPPKDWAKWGGSFNTLRRIRYLLILFRLTFTAMTQPKTCSA